jgi:tetratricopeptide (TPR) repeat protein
VVRLESAIPLRAMRSTLLSCCFLPLFFVSALGQSTTTVVPITPPKGPAATSADSVVTSSDYSAEPFVIEHLDAVYKMAADGTGSKVTTVAMRIQSEASLKQAGVLNIPFASGTQHVEIVYARVRRPDGTVVETAVNQAIEMPSPVTTAAPFYSDLKQLQLPVRSLRVGDTLEWQSKVVLVKSEAPGQFWGQETFADEGIVLSQTMEIHVPKDIYLNVWSPKNKPTETIDGGERVFRWTSSQKKPTVGKEADAEKELKKKQVWTAEQELDAKEGKLPSVAWTTFKSWEAVGAWYQGLESDRIVPDAAVKAKVAELTAGKTTEEEKVRAVYEYVATQIRYIGVAFGIGRYQPHHAGEVLENQYGDCKDKHTLLAAMLSSLGLHPNAVLIGAGVRFNEAVPSPGSFNHLITTVPVGGQAVWLDSTQEVAPYRALVYVIRDKKALVVPNTGVAKIETTPATLPFPSFQKLDAVGTLDKEGTSNSHLVWTIRGDEEFLFRTAFRQVSPGQYDQMVQQISQSIGYQGTTSHAEVSRPEDMAGPMTMSYDYKREKSGDWDNLKIIPQLAPVTLPQIDDKEPPVQAITLGVPRVETSTSAMKLPEGWGVELPEAVHAKSPYATYDETYRFEKGTVYTERRVEVLKETVPVAEWKSYKKWTDDADLAHDQWIQLVTNEHKAASASGESPIVASNAEAAKLISAAYKEIQQHDLDGAKAKLDQAKFLSSNQAFLWSTYGYYEYQEKNWVAAITDYKKELAMYPERHGVYRDIVSAQMLIGKLDDAKETLIKWAEVEPQDPAPKASLSALLMQQGDGAGAVDAAEAAIARLPEDKKKDDRYQLLLGQAQIKAGTKDKGRDTLVAMMKTTQDPMMMNNSAYELAEAGEALAESELATRKAMDTITEETKTWTLDENPQTLSAKSRSLIAIWDTLGWILYREGKLDEADDYLKAAWRNVQSDVMAEHVGAVAEAKGKKDEALTAYVLGIAQSRPGAEQKNLQERADALRKAGAKSSVSDAHTKLQDDRKISLGQARGLNGVTEYRLLLSGGKVVRAEATRGDDLQRLPGGEDRLKEAKLAGLWPNGSQASLVRLGMLNCHSNICELVLEP